MLLVHRAFSGDAFGIDILNNNSYIWVIWELPDFERVTINGRSLKKY